MDYKVRVKAVLDTSGIQKELDRIGQKTKIKTNAAQQSSTSSKKSSLTSEFADTQKQVQKTTQTITTNTTRMSNDFKGVKGSIKGVKTELDYATRSMVIWGGAANVIHGIPDLFKSMAANVKEIDDSMTEMKKVLPYEQLEQLYKLDQGMGGTKGLQKYMDDIAANAKPFGYTVSGMTDAVTEFLKTGQSVTDSLEGAKIAAIYTNIADGQLTAAEAAKFLTAQVKSFPEVANEWIYSVNAVNEVANTQAVGTNDLASAMTIAASSLGTLRNSYSETLGIITAGTEIITNQPRKVAAGMKTIGLGWLKASEDADTYVAASGKVKIALKDQHGDLRSTFDIMTDLSKVWDDLNTAEQNTIALDIGGVTRHDVFTAVMGNWESAIKANKTAQDQLGQGWDENASAVKENARAMESLDKKLQNLHGAWQNFSRKFLNSDFLKAGVDIAAKFIEMLASDVGQLAVKAGLVATAFGLVFTAIKKIVNLTKGLKIFEAVKYLWSGELPDRFKDKESPDIATQNNTDATRRNTDALNRNTASQGGTRGGSRSKSKKIKKTSTGTYTTSTVRGKERKVRKSPKKVVKGKTGVDVYSKTRVKNTTTSAKNIKRLGDVTKKAAGSATVATGAFGKLGSKLSGLLRVLGINPWVLLGTAVVGLGVYLYETTERFEDLSKKAEESTNKVKEFDEQIAELEKKKTTVGLSKAETKQLKELRQDRAVQKDKAASDRQKATRAYRDESGVGDLVTADYSKLLGNTTKAISEQDKAIGKYNTTARTYIGLQQQAAKEVRENGEVSSNTRKKLEDNKKTLAESADTINQYYKAMDSAKSKGQLPKELESSYKNAVKFMEDYTTASEKGQKASFNFAQSLKGINATQLKAFSKKLLADTSGDFDQLKNKVSFVGEAMTDMGRAGEHAFHKLLSGVKGVREAESGKTILDPSKLADYAKQAGLTEDALRKVVATQEKAGNVKWKFNTDSLKGYTHYLEKLETGSIKAKSGLMVSKDAFNKMGKEANLSKSQLKTLEKQLKKAGTKFFDAGADAKTMKKQLQSLKTEIGAVTDESGKIKTVNFQKLKETVQALGGSDKDLEKIISKFDKLEGIKLTGKGAEEFVNSIKMGKTGIDELTGKYTTLTEKSKTPVVVTMKADVDDTFYKMEHTLEEVSARQWVAKMLAKDEASPEVDEVMSQLRTLDDHDWKAIITGEDNSQTTVEKARNRLQNLVSQPYKAQLAAKDGATSVIMKVFNKLNNLNGKTAVTEVKTKITQVFTKVFDTVNRVVGGKKHAKGKRKGEAGGMAWVGDEGSKSNPKPELIQTKKGAYLAGTKGWELVHLDKDDVVYSHRDTKKILSDPRAMVGDFIPRFANGTLSYKDWQRWRQQQYDDYKKQLKQYRATTLKEKKQREKEEKARKKAEAQRKKEQRRQARIARQQRIAARKKDPNYNNPFYIPGLFPKGQDIADRSVSTKSGKSSSKATPKKATTSSNTGSGKSGRSSGTDYSSVQKSAEEARQKQIDSLKEQFENQLQELEFQKEYNSWSDKTFNKKYKQLFNTYNKKLQKAGSSLGRDKQRDMLSILRDTEKEAAKENIEERIDKISVINNDAYVKKAIEQINRVRNERKITAEEAKEYSKEVWKTNFEYLLKEYEDGKVSREKMLQVLNNYYQVSGKKTADYYRMEQSLQESTTVKYQNEIEEQIKAYKNNEITYDRMKETLKNYYNDAKEYTKEYYELLGDVEDAAREKFDTAFDRRMSDFEQGKSNWAYVRSAIEGYKAEIGYADEHYYEMLDELKAATDTHYQAKFDTQIKKYTRGQDSYENILKTLKKYHDTYGEYTEQYYDMLEELRDTAAEVYDTQLDKQIKLYEQGDWAYSNLRDVIKEYYKTVGGYTEEYYEMVDKAEEAALNKFQKQFDQNMNLFNVNRRTYAEMLTILRNYYLEVGHYTEEYYEMWEELAQQAKDNELDRLEELKEQQEARLDVGEKYINKQIDAIDKEIDKLQERNEEEEKTNELMELQSDLAKAQAQRVHIYREDQGFVYERNVESITEAQKALEDFKKEAELDKQVKALEDMKKKWQDILDAIDDAAANKEMQELLDLSGMTLDEFDKMGNSLDAWTGYINNAYVGIGSLEEQIKKLDEAITAMEIHKALPTEQTKDTIVPSTNIYDRPMTDVTTITPNPNQNLPNYSPNQGGNKLPASDHSGIAGTVWDDPNYRPTGGKTLAQLAAEVPINPKTGRRGKLMYSKPVGSNFTAQEIADQKAKIDAINKINGYAQGTLNAAKGLSLVGEKGPELRILNQGDGIIPHTITENLMALGSISSQQWQALISSNIQNNKQPTENITHNHFDKIVLPNVSNGQQFVNELKNLSNAALQSSGRRV